MTTKVMFRVWKNGDVIALFPEEAVTLNPGECNSYMHVGQHGAANSLGVLAESRPAKEEEYSSLLEELGERGYSDIRVIKRTPPDAFANRCEQIQAWRSDS